MRRGRQNGWFQVYMEGYKVCNGNARQRRHSSFEARTQSLHRNHCNRLPRTFQGIKRQLDQIRTQEKSARTKTITIVIEWTLICSAALFVSQWSNGKTKLGTFLLNSLFTGLLLLYQLSHSDACLSIGFLLYGRYLSVFSCLKKSNNRRSYCFTFIVLNSIRILLLSCLLIFTPASLDKSQAFEINCQRARTGLTEKTT